MERGKVILLRRIPHSLSVCLHDCMRYLVLKISAKSLKHGTRETVAQLFSTMPHTNSLLLKSMQNTKQAKPPNSSRCLQASLHQRTTSFSTFFLFCLVLFLVLAFSQPDVDGRADKLWHLLQQPCKLLHRPHAAGFEERRELEQARDRSDKEHVGPCAMRKQKKKTKTDQNTL